MPYVIKQTLIHALLCAAALAAAACAPRRIPPLTVEDLMEDRVTLDGILLKCNQDIAKSRGEADCENARIASERLAAQQVDPEVERKRQADFEHAREQLRLAQEKVRQEQEAKKHVDPYNLPVVPVDPPKTAPPAPTKSDSPPMAGTTSP
jgi:hypothetical protein